MKWTDQLTAAMHYNYHVADSLMALVDDKDLNWKPATGKNWMTVGQLLQHITEACGFCCNGFATGDWGMPEGAEMPEGESMLPPAEALKSVASVKEAREKLAADKKVALDLVQSVGEDRLENEKVSAPWDPMERSLGEQFLSMTLHLQSHKSQLYYYLKLMDRDVNTMHLWGM
ncbi:MAG TPA: DinB family protein [Candidatus Krumholzibacteria bacterium]|nr:DinB family protein [Candidatus Krumholzibacteria bacterium]